jgi:protein-tyrosine-phosphatase
MILSYALKYCNIEYLVYNWERTNKRCNGLKKVMFVCTANTCRSAMAEAILKKRLKEINAEDKIAVYSSGISAYTGDFPTDQAIEVMSAEYDIDLTNHQATNTEESNVELMDLILCMTTSHKAYIIQRYPKLRDKVFSLGEYVMNNKENISIPDPYGFGVKTYSECANYLNNCIELLLKKEGLI